PGRQGNRRALSAPLVKIHRRVVVAEEVVDVRQLEQGAVVVPIEAEGFFQFGCGLAELSLGGQDGTLLKMELGRGPAQLLQAAEDLLGLLRVAGAAQGARTMKLGILRVISKPGRVGEGLR